MKKSIEYYYNIIIKKIVKKENTFYIEDCNANKYIFKNVNVKKINLNILLFTQRDKKFHTILINKMGEYLTKFENKTYALMKINVEKNRKININDLVDILKKNEYKSLYDISNIIEKWCVKVDKFEKFISVKNESVYLVKREYYDYFVGLSENAISYVKYIVNTNIISIGFIYSGIDSRCTLYDLYNPFNIKEGPIMFSVADYLKSIERINVEIIDYILKELKPNYNDFILLISKMLFPMFFYDLFKYDEEKNNQKVFKSLYIDCVNLENKIKYLYYYIRKRHKNMPYIEWIM